MVVLKHMDITEQQQLQGFESFPAFFTSIAGS